MSNTTNTEEFSVPQSNWFKFETVGDNISGTLVKVFQKEGTGNLPSQKVYELVRVTVNWEAQQPDETYNVGIKLSNEYVNSRMSKAKLGQRVKFVFEKEIPPTQKGNHPAKSITPMVGRIDELFTSEEKFDKVDDLIDVNDIPF